jgi:hypothetical protein
MQESIERRGLVVVVDGIAHLRHPAGASIEEGDLIPCGIV